MRWVLIDQHNNSIIIITICINIHITISSITIGIVVMKEAYQKLYPSKVQTTSLGNWTSVAAIAKRQPMTFGTQEPGADKFGSKRKQRAGNTASG